MRATPGATDYSANIYITQDVGGTNPGEPKTGVLFSDLTSASYIRQGAARVAITPITLASASAAHADGGFIEIDATNAPGLYRLDTPDAAIATGVEFVVATILLAGAQNAVASPLHIDLNAQQLGDAFTRLGAPAGASVSADNADIKTVVDGIPTTAMRGTDGVDTATMRGTDGANTTTPDNAGITSNGDAIAVVDGIVDAILVDTAEIGLAGAGLTDLGGMSTAMQAEVNVEVLDVFTVDTFAEPSGVPAATASLKDKIGFLMTAARNKFTQTSTTATIRNDNDSADIASAAVSDDGTTFIRNKHT